MWEDPANADGGKWVLTMKNNPTLLDRCWAWLAMALVGEEVEEGDDICGAVVSLRSKVDRIQVWTRSKDDVERLNGIGRRLVKLLDVSEADGIGLEFQVRVVVDHGARSDCTHSTTRMTAHPPTSLSRSRRCRPQHSALRSVPATVTGVSPLLARRPQAVVHLVTLVLVPLEELQAGEAKGHE